MKAHRFNYELYRGSIDSILPLDHLCRNHSCVNPLHLEQVTHWENTLRGSTPAATDARKTHCIRGHPLAGKNLYLRPTKLDVVVKFAEIIVIRNVVESNQRRLQSLHKFQCGCIMNRKGEITKTCVPHSEGNFIK